MGFLLPLAALLSFAGHCPPRVETACKDARDEDRDGYVDCFDADCSCTNSGGSVPMATCECVLREGEPVCWLDHTARTCRYTDSYTSTSFGPGGRYPVANVDVCMSGCRKFGYLKTVKTAVIVDDSSDTVTDPEVRSAIDLASRWLFEKTGANMELHGIQHVASVTGSMSSLIDSYHASHAAASPHFVAILSGDSVSLAFGGYAVTSSVLSGYCNDFVSPVLGTSRIYGAVIAWNHRFGACGYDFAHYQSTGVWRQTGTVSPADGSCQNQAGIACTNLPAVGYQVCSNLPTDVPYLKDARALVIATFIHEILHSFGTNGNMDHFGTTVCDSAMGGAGYQAGGLHTFQSYTGMCPTTWTNFAGSHAACP